jgi:hypothetical protein
LSFNIAEGYAAEDETMRVYVGACFAAAIIAIVAVIVLNSFQESASVAFSTSAVRLDRGS